MAGEAQSDDPPDQNTPLLRLGRVVRLPGRYLWTGAALADRERFIAARPSKKSQKRLKEKINTLLYRGNPTPWPELRVRLNRLLRGWTEYFSFGQTNQAYSAIHWHVGVRVRRFLCRRHKLRVGGTARFGFGEVYGEMGVLDLYQRRLWGSTAHALS